ncbi:PAS domain S-box protein [Sporosarcina sp. Sa2YVA2]|uniref:histidine kinase n=1 Tax=Sporosarcina quadrami TaxID=2762234 RepID=A0ABR8U733_9BACL|nr:ATP-binding protein [Sporosarcina quadrami]MBD7983339.1 PAS domain S-box protein [Sporosarcina quadrami]
MKNETSFRTRNRFFMLVSLTLVLFLLFTSIINEVHLFIIITEIIFIVLMVLYFSSFTLFQKKRKIVEEDYLELFYNQSQDAIAVFSLDSKIITVNPAFLDLYQYTEEECIGKPLEFYDPIEKELVEERIKLLLKGHSFKNIRTKEQRKDGSTFISATTLTPMYKENRLIAISVLIRNIDERIESDKLVIECIRMNAFGELAASVAHEIRNPLTSVSGFVQMMNMDNENPYRVYTEIMESEIDRINLIVNEFIILSKPHLKTRSELNIELILFEVEELFKDKLNEKNIICDIYLAEFPFTISGNSVSLQQLFINLLKNAIDAIGNGGSITFIVALNNNHVTITIRDTGCGIPSEISEQLFTPFFSTKEEAAGLGLIITKKIVLDHQGTIKINEDFSDGTEITVTFPTTSINGKPTAISTSKTVT